jgi:hypothetical protein
MKINNFIIVPYEKIGDLSFGESRIEIRKKYPEYEEFRKTPFSQNTTDAYGDCHLGYNLNNELESVETFPGVSVTIYGNEISKNKKYSEVKSFLMKMDPEIQEDECGLTSFKLGIGIYLEKNDGCNNDIQSIIIFCKGYYD